MLRSRILATAIALAPAIALAAPSSEIQSLRRQIAALQLDHALALTNQQAQALLPLVEEARAKVAAVKSQAAASEPAVVAALTQAVADLKANGAVSASTVQALQAARPGSLSTLRQDLRSLWSQAKQILTPDQLSAVKTVNLGVGQGANASAQGTNTDAQGGKMGPRRFMRRMLVSRTLLSDEFFSLLQARAS